MKKWIILLCFLILSSCATQRSKDYAIRRNLMLLENYELPRNKQLKSSKYKMHKQLDRRNKKYLRKIKRQG